MKWCVEQKWNECEKEYECMLLMRNVNMQTDVEWNMRCNALWTKMKWMLKNMNVWHCHWWKRSHMNEKWTYGYNIVNDNGNEVDVFVWMVYIW